MGTSPLDLKNCLCANVRKTDRALSRAYDRALRPSGLTASQFALLSVLWEAGPLRISDLARFMNMDQTTVTRNVDLMNKEGWVTTVPSQDRRTRVVALTDQGNQTHGRALPLWSQVQSALTTALGSPRWEAFLEDLSRVQNLVQSSLSHQEEP